MRVLKKNQGGTGLRNYQVLVEYLAFGQTNLSE